MTQRLFACLLVLSSCICAQHRVDSQNLYQRIICVVPMVGSGTPSDPKRPQYAPWPPSRSRAGIIAFSHQVSDDGQHALVEFIALDRSAFQAIFNDKSIKVFEKGKDNIGDVVNELKKYIP
ncbi:conserved exported hypothetical protein [Candidatus Sulfopaludibacter sp. SbA4]|nr:conserved exported hypothetical protein [Candidatus Sulfopaludibacter sp. SbA4]